MLNGGKSTTVIIVVVVVELLVRALWNAEAMNGGERILSNMSSHNGGVI